MGLPGGTRPGGEGGGAIRMVMPPERAHVPLMHSLSRGHSETGRDLGPSAAVRHLDKLLKNPKELCGIRHNCRVLQREQILGQMMQEPKAPKPAAASKGLEQKSGAGSEGRPLPHALRALKPQGAPKQPSGHTLPALSSHEGAVLASNPLPL